jgi:hypothetical protein
MVFLCIEVYESFALGTRVRCLPANHTVTAGSVHPSHHQLCVCYYCLLEQSCRVHVLLHHRQLVLAQSGMEHPGYSPCAPASYSMWSWSGVTGAARMCGLCMHGACGGGTAWDTAAYVWMHAV